MFEPKSAAKNIFDISFGFIKPNIVFKLLQHLRGNAARLLLEGIRKSTREMIEEQEAVRGRLFTIQDVMQSTVRAWLQGMWPCAFHYPRTIWNQCGWDSRSCTHAICKGWLRCSSMKQKLMPRFVTIFQGITCLRLLEMHSLMQISYIESGLHFNFFGIGCLVECSMIMRSSKPATMYAQVSTTFLYFLTNRKRR